jgi:hypothetical protein
VRATVEKAMFSAVSREDALHAEVREQPAVHGDQVGHRQQREAQPVRRAGERVR